MLLISSDSVAFKYIYFMVYFLMFSFILLLCCSFLYNIFYLLVVLQIFYCEGVACEFFSFVHQKKYTYYCKANKYIHPINFRMLTYHINLEYREEKSMSCILHERINVHRKKYSFFNKVHKDITSGYIIKIVWYILLLLHWLEK